MIRGTTGPRTHDRGHFAALATLGFFVLLSGCVTRTQCPQLRLSDRVEPLTEVVVLGMIHGRHRASTTWGLDQVRETIRAINPDVVCVEIPPDRWPRVASDWNERHVVEDDRVQRFPEYTDVLLPLTDELDFVVEPCAAWTQRMADERRERMRQFREDPEHAETRQRHDSIEAAIEAKHAADPIDDEDPRVIHSTRYDLRTKESLGPYDLFLNDWIGAGGWTNINAAHYRLIEDALSRHAGKRILITFGAGHKYWFLEQLRQRHDIRLLDVAPFLPGAETSEVDATSTSMDESCRIEIIQLHQFFDNWFNGLLPNDDKAHRRFTSVMAEGFQIVNPNGKLTPLADLERGIRDNHSAYPGTFRIWIENIDGRPVGPDMHLVTYEEWQELEGRTRGRLSTALFRRREGTPNGVEWLHVHETWLGEKG